jgi:restriction system protein
VIPTYDKMMLPILRELAGGTPKNTDDCVNAISRHFQLSSEDLAHHLPSGRQTTVRNRVGWARVRLRKAGLIESTARGIDRITETGLGVLESGVEALNDDYLMRFQPYRAWVEQFSDTVESPLAKQDETVETLTPEEAISVSYARHRQGVQDDLLARVRTMDPYGFERLVVELLVKLGYGGALGEGQAIGRSGDGGVDGVIREDKLGLELVYVQAKRWANGVGRPEVQAFIGSLEGLRARKGVFITTSTFSREARDYVERIEKRVVLIDGQELAQLMFEAGVAVTVTARYEVKAVDTDFFVDA